MELVSLISSNCDLESAYTKAIASDPTFLAPCIYLSFVLNKIDIAQKFLSIKPQQLLDETIVVAMVNEDTDTVNILLTYGSPNWHTILKYGIVMNNLAVLDYTVRYLEKVFLQQ